MTNHLHRHQIKAFDFNYEACRLLREKYWHVYDAEAFVKFHYIREAIRDFYRDRGEACNYTVSVNESKTCNEVFTHEFANDPSRGTVFYTHNNLSPILKLAGKFDLTVDQTVKKMHERRMVWRDKINHPIHQVVRDFSKLLMNLHGEVRCEYIPQMDGPGFSVNITWAAYFNRDALAFRYFDND